MSLISHAMQALNCFNEREQELRLSDISRKLGIGTSHAHKLLSVLVDEGFLKRGPNSPKYRLGLRLYELGRLAVSELDPPAALPGMHQLGMRTGESIVLAVREGADVLFLQRVDSLQTLKVCPPLNRRYPAWIAAGQALLAWEDEAEIAFVSRQLFPPGSEDALERTDHFRDELEATRRLGYAVNDPIRGIRAMAAPVREPGKAVVAALSLAAPAQRLIKGQIPGVASLMKRAAEELSIHLADLPTGAVRDV